MSIRSRCRIQRYSPVRRSELDGGASCGARPKKEGHPGTESQNAKSHCAGEPSLLPARRRAEAGAITIAEGTSRRQQIADGAGRRAVHVAQVLERAPGEGNRQRNAMSPLTRHTSHATLSHQGESSPAAALRSTADLCGPPLPSPVSHSSGMHLGTRTDFVRSPL
jgi:hypothetical protein